MLLIAFMECTQIYDDESLKEYEFLLDPASVCTVQSMPDLCYAALHVKLWQDPEDDLSAPKDLYWSNILTSALPNPCKGRSINIKLAKDVLHNNAVYDVVLRILFGSFLGVYGDAEPASFETRVMCYAAFSLYPPTPEELSEFLLQKKIVVAFCFRSYLMFLFGLTPMRGWLCQRYEWETIEKTICDGMNAFRRQLHLVAYGPGFLTTNAGWKNIENELVLVNKAYKKHVFRAADKPFYARALQEMEDIQRAELKKQTHETRVTSLPVIKYSAREIHYVMSKDGFVNPSFVKELTDVSRWNRLPSNTTQEILQAQDLYDREIKMTTARKFLYGSRKDGLYYKDRESYDLLESFYRACEVRLKSRWGYLPFLWRERQEKALQKRTGKVHNPTYFYCPKCTSIRSNPVTFPEGNDLKKQHNAFYSKGIRLDLGTMQHYCVARNNERRKNAILRRRNRGVGARYVEGDDIMVCDGTPVFPVQMLGVVFFTFHDGLLLLCVDCACIMAFTPESMTARGPTCGCQNPVLKEPLVSCGLCEEIVPKKKTRTQVVLGDEEIENMSICKKHWTGFANNKGFMFSINILRFIQKHSLKVRMSSDGTPFFVRYKT